MREKRDQLFNRRRFGLELDSRSMQDTLTEIIREEFKNLATSDDNGTFVFKEIDEPLSQEEAIELENEIVHEQGLIETLDFRIYQNNLIYFIKNFLFVSNVIINSFCL